MPSPVDDVLKQVSAELTQQGFNEQLLDRAFTRIEAIPIETEEDRLSVLHGFLELIDILSTAAPKDVVVDLKTARQQLQTRLDIYGSNSRNLLAALTDVNDATRLRQALAAVIERIEGENPLLVLPAFAGSYPSQTQRELFHVSAFREWSKPLQEEAEAACVRAGVKYCIGYARMNPDIIRIIWRDICQASFVVADITNLNPNAVLELGMAHALGRPTLVVTQNKQTPKYFPAVQKVRTHQYAVEKGSANLDTLLDNFLAGAQ